MNPSVKLVCEPLDLAVTMGNISSYLQDGSHIAQVEEAKEGMPASLKFRRSRFGDKLACFSSKTENEMAEKVQAALEHNLVRGNEHLQQAYRDIATFPSCRTVFYQQFFSLHLFRKNHNQNLQWLPLVYLRIRQTSNNFDPLMESMKPRLSQLRDKARNGPNPAYGDENPNLYFVSAEGEHVHAHTQWLSQSKLIREAAPQPAGNIIPVVFPENSKPKSQILHLFLDIVYGVQELPHQSSADLESLYNLAESLKCEKLRLAAYKNMQIAIRREMDIKYPHRTSTRTR
jgi:hypothetical protein